MDAAISAGNDDSFPPDASAAPMQPWSWPLRVGFRFCFAYYVLYCLPGSGESSIFGGLPWIGDELSAFAAKPWMAVWHAVGLHLFHLSEAVTRPHPTGSGDTTLSYLQLFCNVAIAAVATVTWTVLDRRRMQYRTLYAWLRLLVRFSLAFTMLGYGFVKIFPLQFSPPGALRLSETYGDSSPMALLWTFMGASTAYTIFSGTVEAIAGLLLLFRWTTLLGSLVAMGVTLNIVLLNFCYDVPVKLFSTHLLLMAIFLTLPYWPALWHFFVLHRPARPHGVWVPPFTRRWMIVASRVLQVVVIVSVLATNIWQGYTGYITRYHEPEPPLVGVWNVMAFSSDKASSPTVVPWERVAIADYGVVRITDQGGDTSRTGDKVDMKKQTLTFSGRGWTHVGEFSFTMAGPQEMRLDGAIDHEPVKMQLQRVQKPYLLMTRGFHWISEDPFNQ